jgi:CRP-like cAMP-binding protein
MDNQFLIGLDSEQRQAVLRLANRRRFNKGDAVFHEGDPGDTLHLLMKGFVAIRVTTPMGETATLTVLGPSDFFGEQALLSSTAVRTASAVALDAVETLTLGSRHFEELRVTDPRVDRLLVAVLGAQVRRLSTQLLEALYQSAEIRVVRRLHELTEVFGGQTPEGPVSIPVTQEDLSTMAGTTRPTANRVLHDLASLGVVELARGRIVVLDAAGLAKRGR